MSPCFRMSLYPCFRMPLYPYFRIPAGSLCAPFAVRRLGPAFSARWSRVKLPSMWRVRSRRDTKWTWKTAGKMRMMRDFSRYEINSNNIRKMLGVPQGTKWNLNNIWQIRISKTQKINRKTFLNFNRVLPQKARINRNQNCSVVQVKDKAISHRNHFR